MTGKPGKSGGARPGAGRPSGKPTKRFTLQTGDIFIMQRPYMAMEMWRVKELTRTVMIISRVEKIDGPELEEIRIVR